MRFLPPAGRHRRGYRGFTGWCRGALGRVAFHGLQVSCGRNAIAMLARRSPRKRDVGRRRHVRDAGGGRRNAHSLAGFARRASRDWGPERMRLASPGAIRDYGHHGTPPRMRRYPARCLPAGGRNQMDNTPTSPRAVGSRGTGAGAPSSRARASARARRVRHCGVNRARLTVGVGGSSRRVPRASAKHREPRPPRPPTAPLLHGLRCWNAIRDATVASPAKASRPPQISQSRLLRVKMSTKRRGSTKRTTDQFVASITK